MLSLSRFSFFLGQYESAIMTASLSFPITLLNFPVQSVYFTKFMSSHSQIIDYLVDNRLIILLHNSTPSIPPQYTQFGTIGCYLNHLTE